MRIAFVCLLLVLAGCGGGGSSPPSPPSQTPPSGIGPAGGTVSNGGAQVVVPAGALAQATSIAIEQTNSGAPENGTGLCLDLEMGLKPALYHWETVVDRAIYRTIQ